MKVLGITGSIGMGKSTLSSILEERGVPVHHADAAVHQLLGGGGKAVGKIAQIFPTVIQINADDTPYVDRQALGNIVFKDKAKKKQLEDILHPLVREMSDAFLAESKEKGLDVVGLDIPLLFETEGRDRVDYVLTVTAPLDVQRDRVLKRPGMTLEKFERILATQVPDAEKCQKSDFVINTDQDLSAVAKDVEEMLAKIKSMPVG